MNPNIDQEQGNLRVFSRQPKMMTQKVSICSESVIMSGLNYMTEIIEKAANFSQMWRLLQTPSKEMDFTFKMQPPR